ncbi:unnamed protein product [Mesocestoides corti]|uniref:HTH_48 domain-containing protein n=1 Tax=Mesocestoides corti TaxID=53468 RepID=A0A0R3UB06_MESCO|nr:unnamed protein product [Mesocestoides corti]
MATGKYHIRQCILCELLREKKASKSRELICSALGANVVSYEMCNYWYKRFRSVVFFFAIRQSRCHHRRSTQEARKYNHFLPLEYSKYTMCATSWLRHHSASLPPNTPHDFTVTVA